ncbi:MAG: radical SAM protein [Candidatus Lokiarchaeota archaeon]|nr:radical SAM protein [Candidatus Lokiarchaeota archaeon]
MTREGRCELLAPYRIDPPATLLIIASILREKNHDIEFIDANGLNLDYSYVNKFFKKRFFDVVIFTFAAKISDYELKICEIVKGANPECITIGYSWYGKYFYQEILSEYPNLDILMIEDPFSIIEDLITTIENKGELNNIGGISYRNSNKNIKINRELKKRVKIEDLPLPAYDLVKSFQNYHIFSPLLRPYALVYAGKGCPYSCQYCLVANTKYSSRTADSIVKELKYLQNEKCVKYVWFFDEIFTLNRKKIIEMCVKIKKEKIKIKWFCDSRVELVDLKMLKMMKKAGCIGISYGVESGSQKILNSMNKGTKVSQAMQALQWTRKARIPIQLNLLLGYVGENEETLKETEIFVKNTLPEILQISKISPMFGSEFVKLCLKNQWIDDRSSWKEKLNASPSDLKNYPPLSLDLDKEIKKLRKILRFNPKWWIITLFTLLRNKDLILPVVGAFLKHSSSINLI